MVDHTDLWTALTVLAQRPAVAAHVDRARDAGVALRLHPALRRRAAEVRAEVLVRATHASAALDGAVVPLETVRAMLAAPGDAAAPEDPVQPSTGRLVPTDPALVVARGALRLLAEVDRTAGGLAGAPFQALARWHAVAAAGLADDDRLGRPLEADSPRLQQLSGLLQAPPRVPALLVGALATAELATLRPFGVADGVLARAVLRAVIVGRGLDPQGVVLFEPVVRRDAERWAAALQDYATGRPAAVEAWIGTVADMLVEGVPAGRAAADAVLAGRW